MGGHGRVKIVAGSARNMDIELPASARPTLSRVKEGMFSSIHFELLNENVKCLDLCAGSGALGIEALSRGAEHCVFVESNRDACRIIKNNLKITSLEEKAEVLNLDAKHFLGGTSFKESFDIIFFDPPYEEEKLYDLTEQIPGILKPGGKVLIESIKGISREFEGLTLHKIYRYGSVIVSKYHFKD